jgi:glutamine synthetase
VTETGRQLLDRVRAEQLDYVRCQFIDVSGILRGRAVHRSHLPAVLERGIPFAQINNIVDIDDAESDLALGSQAGDFWAVPDPSTLHRVPHTNASGQMFADLVAGDGSPWPTCGRALVRRIDELVGSRRRSTSSMPSSQTSAQPSSCSTSQSRS